MNQYYLIIYLENGRLKDMSFYLKDRGAARDFAKAKKGYLILAMQEEHFKEA